jgi:hypothetical protein
MFRKSMLALAAVATVSAAALVPTTASAHYRWGGWGFRTGVYLAAPLTYGYYSYGSASCLRYVQTPSGYLKKVWVPCYY